MTQITFRATRDDLGSFDGATIGWLIVDATGYAALDPIATVHVDDITGELDDDVVTGYARGEMDVVTEDIGDATLLKRDPLYAVPSTDTTDGFPAGVVFFEAVGGDLNADATNRVIAALPVPAGPGFDDWEIVPADGIAITRPGDATGASTAEGVTIADGDAPMHRAATAVATYEAAADGLGVPEGAQATTAGTLPYVITAAGATQQQINENASSAQAYALARIDGAIYEAAQATAAVASDLNDTEDEVDALTGRMTGAEGVTALTAEALHTPTPTRWLECGTGYYDDPTPDRGYASCPTRHASPTTSLEIETTSRHIASSGSAASEGTFQELRSEPMDDGGSGGDGGVWDRFEKAVRFWNNLVWLFIEWTATGGTEEWHTSAPGRATPQVLGIPTGVWVVTREIWDLAAGTWTFQVRTEVHYDTVDSRGNWRTLGVYEMGEAGTLAASTAVEQWIGRGEGRFDIAAQRVLVDGVLVSEPDIAGAETTDTTIADSALGDVWTLELNAAIGAAPDAGAVDSVNGETGTVVLDAADVGAVPIGRLVNGLDLSADRVLPNNLRSHLIPAALGWAAASATPTRSISGARWLGSYLDFANTTTPGQWVEWDVSVDAGTWTLTMFGDTLATSGTVTLTLDGDTIGTWNQYSAGTVTGVVAEITGIVVAANGPHTLRVTNTAPGVGAGTYGGRFSAFQWRRTA